MRTPIVAVVLFIASLLAPEHAARGAAPEPDRVVVLFSLDGLANFYFDDPKAEMPTIRRLAEQGARAASMKSSVPTVTWPNHTTLVTGVHPARHGVLGNNYLDRKTLKHVALIGDAVYEKDQIVRVPTIYDAAKNAGLKTASIRWPATRGSKTLGWQTPDVSAIELLKSSMTPELMKDAIEAGVWKEIQDAEQREASGRWLPTDELCTRLFNLVLERHRPNLALLHLIDIDHQQHKYGPRTPEAYQAIKETDGRVREVVDVLEKHFSGKYTVVIASDHGFSPIEKLILPNVVLRKSKLMNSRDGDDTKPLVRFVAQGGCAALYVVDESKRDETVKRLREAFSGMEGVAKVVGPEEAAAYGVATPADDPRAPDVRVFAKLGYAFGDTAAGDLPFVEKPERKGTHGHDPNLPELKAAFVASGAGIKPGARAGDIENTDVTPTIAKLLGFEMKGLDGRALDEILDAGAAH